MLGYLLKVSVPSRGNGVIDLMEKLIQFIADNGEVSVPSRGNGVIDLTTMTRTIAHMPRPVSVPSRGNGVIDPVQKLSYSA